MGVLAEGTTENQQTCPSEVFSIGAFGQHSLKTTGPRDVDTSSPAKLSSRPERSVVEGSVVRHPAFPNSPWGTRDFVAA